MMSFYYTIYTIFTKWVIKAIAHLVEPSSLILVHLLRVAPVSHSFYRLICQGFVGSGEERKHLDSEDDLRLKTIVF